MTDIILHHYDTSPMRRKFEPGLASRAFPGHRSNFPRSCETESDGADGRLSQDARILQIWRDIYCDSQLIMRELERRYPTPSFYPAGHGRSRRAWPGGPRRTTFFPAVSIAFAKRPSVAQGVFSKTGPSSPVEISIPSQ